jgi:type IV pilus assembly protein PilA
MRRETQRGYTIIELLLVVMIIGILAALVLPSVRENSARAKVTEALLASGGCKAAVSEIYLSNGVAPSDGEWGCERLTGPVSQYVETVRTTSEGIILVDINGTHDLRLDHNTITLEPLDASGNLMTDGVGPVRSWRCGKVAPSLTTLSPKYLPGSCRG